MKRRTAAELIAFHLGWDWNDVKECRYQSTRYVSPAIYALGDSYFCAPTERQKLPEPEEFGLWEKVGDAYGRPIYRANGGTV